jgi:hypothetical protein
MVNLARHCAKFATHYVRYLVPSSSKFLTRVNSRNDREWYEKVQTSGVVVHVKPRVQSVWRVGKDVKRYRPALGLVSNSD